MTRYHITAIGEYKFYLILNPMMGQSEGKQQFGPFNTFEEVKMFYDGEKVEPYREEGPNGFSSTGKVTYGKNFRKGGPLEWMNPINLFNHEELKIGLNHYGHGIAEVLIDVKEITRGGVCNY